VARHENRWRPADAGQHEPLPDVEINPQDEY